MSDKFNINMPNPPLFVVGSSSRFDDQRLAANVMPVAVLSSWDWAVRTDPSPPFVSQSRGAMFDWENKIGVRRRVLSPFAWRLPEAWRMDMAFARWSREQCYVGSLFEAFTWDELTSINGLSASLVVTECHVSESRASLSYCGQGVVDKQWTMPKDLRTFERKERHRTRHFIPAHCQEAVLVKAEHLSRRYVPCPPWWRRVEVPYGMRPETPPCLAYYGSVLREHPDHPAWSIVRSEWAVEVAKDLLIQARAGRLYWIPEGVRSDLESMDLSLAFNDLPVRAYGDLMQLLLFVDELRWSQCPEENRLSAPENANLTPLHVTGDYFEFDPVTWAPMVDESLRIPRDSGNKLTEERDVRGPARGRGHGLRSVRAPSGYSRGRNAAYPTSAEIAMGRAPRMLGLPRGRPSDRSQRVARIATVRAALTADLQGAESSAANAVAGAVSTGLRSVPVGDVAAARIAATPPAEGSAWARVVTVAADPPAPMEVEPGEVVEEDNGQSTTESDELQTDGVAASPVVLSAPPVTPADTRAGGDAAVVRDDPYQAALTGLVRNLVQTTVARRMAMEERRERLSSPAAAPQEGSSANDSVERPASSAAIEEIDLTGDEEPQINRSTRGATAERLLRAKEEKALVVVSPDGDRMVEDPVEYEVESE